MDVLASRTLRKVEVINIKRDRSASKRDPSDGREAHRGDGQLTHTCMERVSSVHPPLDEGK